MPPRRHVVPPPTNPSSASPPPPDVDPGLTTDLKPLPPVAGPTPRRRPSRPRSSPTSHLQPRQREVYRAIFAAGSGGMSAQDIRNATGLSADAGGKQARSLVGLGVLKVVPDVRNRRRNIFMAVEFKPSDEVSGGTWYHDGKVDAGAIAAARRRCLAQVKRLGAATADMIHEGVRRYEPGAGYTVHKIADILRTMVLDNTLEEVRSTGEGEFAAVRRGTMCYREPGKQHPGGMMEGIPCGVCPMIDDCSPEGIISPSTCVYYQKWLELDF